MKAPIQRSAVLGCLAVLLVASSARAQRADRVSLDVSAGLGMQHVLALPTASLVQEELTDLRQYPANARLSLGTPLTTMGVYAASNLRIGRNWLVPIVHLGLGRSVGHSADVLSNANGTLTRVSPWSANVLDISALGVGFNQSVRRFSFGAKIMPGLVWMTPMDVRVIEGGRELPLEGGAQLFYFTVRAHIEACRRLDPWNRMCVVFSPSLFEGRFMNGFGFSFKWEIEG